MLQDLLREHFHLGSKSLAGLHEASLSMAHPQADTDSLSRLKPEARCGNPSNRNRPRWRLALSGSHEPWTLADLAIQCF